MISINGCAQYIIVIFKIQDNLVTESNPITKPLNSPTCSFRDMRYNENDPNKAAEDIQKGLSLISVFDSKEV